MGEWVSVRSCLPDEDVRVLFIDTADEIWPGWLHGGDWRRFDNDRSYPRYVTHWMPLPEPPR